MKRRFIVFGAVLAVIVATGASAFPGVLSAAAAGPTATVTCGEQISSSITVANDLTCPVNAAAPFGLVVMGKSKITVDLNGHKISGPRVLGASADVAVGHSVEMTGVALFGSGAVTVKNGTITHFDAGVSDTYGTANKFVNLKVVDNRNYGVVSGDIDYLPGGSRLSSVVATGTGTTTYTYFVATAQTLGAPDNGTDGHSYTQDSTISGGLPVPNASPLSSTNYNTLSVKGPGPGNVNGSATANVGVRIIRQVGTGALQLLATVANTGIFTFKDDGSYDAGATSYTAVSLANLNIGKDDTCDNGDGILLTASTKDVVASNTAAGNGPFSGVALIGNVNTAGTSWDPVSKNTVSDNSISWSSPVLNVDPGFNNWRNAHLNAYCGTGVGGGGMTRGRTDQDSAVRLEGPNAISNTVDSNAISNAPFNGIAIHSYVCGPPPPGNPPGLPNSYNTIDSNSISGTGANVPASAGETNFDGIGWLSSGPSGTVCPSPNNTVTNNVSFNNLRNGIYMGGRANNSNTVAQNTVYGNSNDGIFVDLGCSPPSTCGGTFPTFGNNTFTQNVGYSNGAAGGYGSTTFDAVDRNPNCNGDSWSADTFTAASPSSCVQ